MQLFLTNPLLDGLNDEQQQAVLTLDGPIQLVASAGSGKTTVLTRRIANMINEGIKSESILAVTFTRKAATEMSSRLKKLVTSKKLIENLTIGTYHSICLELLKPNYKLLGFTSDKPPSLCIEGRMKTIIKTILADTMAPFLPDETTTLLGQIKNMGIYPEEFKNLVDQGRRPIKSVNEQYLADLSEIYLRYQNYLRESNLIDYDDILMLTRKLLISFPEVRAKYQQRFKYVLVDEFQDVNQVQFDISSLLAAPQNNFFVVGDDAQSIYQFRGSDVGIILSFSKQYPETKLIKLENNYRSTPEIINISNKLIKFNREQIQKTVKATRNSIGDSINFYEAEDVSDESFYIGKQIKNVLLKGIKPQEIAILYRNHTQANYIEEDLIALKIPYTIHRNGSFYDLPEVQDLFAYLYLAKGDKGDLEQGFERLFRASGLNSKTTEIIRKNAKDNSIDMLESCMQTMSLNIHPGQKGILDKLIQNILRWQAKANSLNVADLITFILESSGYIQKLENKNTESAYNSINNLNIIYDRAKKWNSQTVSDFFKEIETQEIKRKENKNKKQAVQLMTIHNSKGMEFDTVFLIGLEEEILPHKKSISIGNINEERRLCYVAMTRARKYLFLSRVQFRNRFGKRHKTTISRFWQEINDQVTM